MCLLMATRRRSRGELPARQSLPLLCVKEDGNERDMVKDLETWTAVFGYDTLALEI
jgi:hypothetical protein